MKCTEDDSDISSNDSRSPTPDKTSTPVVGKKKNQTKFSDFYKCSSSSNSPDEDDEEENEEDDEDDEGEEVDDDREKGETQELKPTNTSSDKAQLEVVNKIELHSSSLKLLALMGNSHHAANNKRKAFSHKNTSYEAYFNSCRNFLKSTSQSGFFTNNIDDDFDDEDDERSNDSYNDYINMPQFSRSAVGGAKFLTSCHPVDEGYTGLMFESRFESGNLSKAVRITPTYYELYLRPDLYTNRSKQWFYFRVSGTKSNITYR